MFGGVGVSGVQELQGYDSNHDGKVDGTDARGRPPLAQAA